MNYEGFVNIFIVSTKLYEMDKLARNMYSPHLFHIGIDVLEVSSYEVLISGYQGKIDNGSW